LDIYLVMNAFLWKYRRCDDTSTNLPPRIFARELMGVERQDLKAE
jgi:hypothetical protein